MLLAFHIVLVTTGILFSFGFAILQLVQYGREGSPLKLLMGILFVVGGTGLSIYLRRVLRYGLRGGPR